MIHVDTNILIEMITLGSSMAKNLRQWLKTGEQLATSAIAWSEFLSGPVSQNQINGVRTILADQIVPFGVSEAATAASVQSSWAAARRARGFIYCCLSDTRRRSVSDQKPCGL